MSKRYNKKEIIQAIKGTQGIVSAIAERLKCDWHTAKKHIDKYEETKKALQDEIESFGDFVENKAMEKVNDGSETMIRFYLATKYKTRGFTEKHEVEHSGDKENPVRIESRDKLDKIVSRMTDEQRKIFFDIIEQNNGID